VKYRFKIRHFRLAFQFFVGFLILNMTIFGAYVIAPLLPVIRFDYPNTPNTLEGGQRVCDVGIMYRGLSSFYPWAFLIVSIALLLLICAVVGRACCGWICPIGFFQDLVTKVRTTLGIKPKEFSKKTHDRMVMVKYSVFMLAILLAAATGLSLIANFTAGVTYKGMFPEGTSQIAPFCAVCPAPSIYYMGSILDTGDFQFSDPTRYLAILVLGAVFVGGFAQPRFWCRYLCPVGATSSFFNKVSILSLRKDQDKCTKCNYCTSSCHMRVNRMQEEDKMDRIVDTNCTFCLDCIEACPEKALSLSLASKPFYKGGRDWWKKENINSSSESSINDIKDGEMDEQ
jgi:polyferredoxin